MDKIQKLIQLTQEAKTQYLKFTVAENIAAAVRCRKMLSEIKQMAQDTRTEILARQKEIDMKRYRKSDK